MGDVTRMCSGGGAWPLVFRLRSSQALAAHYASSLHILRNFKSPTLGLPLGCAHHQAVELGRHLDLAGQARVRLHIVAEVEHVLLHRRGLAHRRTPRLVDMHVAGGAGAGAAAFRLDAGNAVLDRRLHHGRTELTLDRAGRAFMIDIGDFRHTIGGTNSRYAAARWRPIAAHTRARQMTTRNWPAALLRLPRVSRAQRSTSESDVVRCSPGTAPVRGGPGSSVDRFAGARAPPRPGHNGYV